MTGLAVVLRSVEARLGRISLRDYHGLFNQMPVLAGFFLLTGLASIGFPGTIGFIASELLIEGAVGVQPAVAVVLVLAIAMNSIAVLMAYFKIFTGRQHQSTVSLQIRATERFAVLILALLILAGFWYLSMVSSLAMTRQLNFASIAAHPFLFLNLIHPHTRS